MTLTGAQAAGPSSGIRDSLGGPAHFTHLIDGEHVNSADGRTFETTDPHTGEVYGTVAEGGAEDVRRAAAAARKAFDSGPWPRMPRAERRKLLEAFADRVDECAEELAQLESRDMGKPIAEARHMDAPRVSHNLRFFAELQATLPTELYPREGTHTYTRYEPVGVTAAIAPWNFPMMLASWKVAPALAFGNTVVLKPAEQSPATATRLGELAAEVLPPGVLNVLHGFGPDAAGELLVRDPGVNLVTFTGESKTGSAVMAAAAPTLKGISLELGGKSPNIVFADANLEAAVTGSLRASFMNQGEVCLAGSRLYVQREIRDEFMSLFVERAAQLKVGDPLDAATNVGPLVTAEHLGRVRSYLDIARADGGQFLLGGDAPLASELRRGFYLTPTIVEGLPQDSRCVREEIFGPVLTVSTFETEEEVLALANDTAYGLAAMVWTTDLGRAHRMTERLDAGQVWVNCFFVRDLRAPFGGMKRSGIGREGGIHSREFFTEPKAITIDLSASSPSVPA